MIYRRSNKEWEAEHISEKYISVLREDISEDPPDIKIYKFTIKSIK